MYFVCLITVLDYLNKNYYNATYRSCLFNEMSCEMIGRELLDEFKLNYCSVFEDNENGAEIYV